MTSIEPLISTQAIVTQGRERVPVAFHQRIPDWLWTIISLTICVVVWQLFVMISGVPEITLPAPTAVWQAIVENGPLLIEYSLVTLREILIGFALAVIVGVPVAITIAFVPLFEKMVYPVIVLTQAIPTIAVAPLFLIWFGFGPLTNAMIALMVAVFPIIINTTLGLTSLESDYLRLAKVMGGNRWRTFRLVRLPAALPSIFAGLKLGMVLATIGAVVGEFNAGSSGLGYLSLMSAGQLNTPLTFASIVLLAVLGIALFYAIAAIERISIRWHHALTDHN